MRAGVLPGVEQKLSAAQERPVVEQVSLQPKGTMQSRSPHAAMEEQCSSGCELDEASDHGHPNKSRVWTGAAAHREEPKHLYFGIFFQSDTVTVILNMFFDVATGFD